MQTTLLSVISLANLGLTLGIVLFLWWNRTRILGANGNGNGNGVTSRQYERLVHRFDTFEQDTARRSKEDTDFRRNVLEANDAQLDATEKQNGLLKKVLSGQQYLKGTVSALPCHDFNGDIAEKVPDDCPGEKRKKT
jgi:hypothetical protein